MLHKLGPIRLEPVYLPKVWAAPVVLGDLGQSLAVPPNTGEIWLASARHHITKVAEGKLAGMGLDELAKEFSRTLLGPNQKAGFPFLLKLLNVGDWLSVQVHPDDQMARRLENEPWGKNEAWHVLEALPNAEIVMGFKPGADSRQVEEAVWAGEQLSDLLAKVPAQKGDTFMLPAGTVHATGPGLLIFEAQQPSDVTYRFYDWNRPEANGSPRPLHHEKALKAMQKNQPPSKAVDRLELYRAPNLLELLVQTSSFSLLRAVVSQTYRPWWGGARLRVAFIVEGQGEIVSPNDYFPPKPVTAGQAWLFASGLTTPLIIPKTDRLVLLESVA